MPAGRGAKKPRSDLRQLSEPRSAGLQPPRWDEHGTPQIARARRREQDTARRDDALGRATIWPTSARDRCAPKSLSFRHEIESAGEPSRRQTGATGVAPRQTRHRTRCQKAEQSPRHNRAGRCRAAGIRETTRGRRQRPGYRWGDRFTPDSPARSRYLALPRLRSAGRWTIAFPRPPLAGADVGSYP